MCTIVPRPVGIYNRPQNTGHVTVAIWHSAAPIFWRWLRGCPNAPAAWPAILRLRTAMRTRNATTAAALNAHRMRFQFHSATMPALSDRRHLGGKTCRQDACGPGEQNRNMTGGCAATLNVHRLGFHFHNATMPAPSISASISATVLRWHSS